jgi:hypothetical protein
LGLFGTTSDKILQIAMARVTEQVSHLENAPKNAPTGCGGCGTVAVMVWATVCYYGTVRIRIDRVNTQELPVAFPKKVFCMLKIAEEWSNNGGAGLEWVWQASGVIWNRKRASKASIGAIWVVLIWI